MPAEQNSRLTTAVALGSDRHESESSRFVTVAIPEKLDQSKNLKADLESYDIPAFLEIEEAEMDAEKLGGIPVLVPECIFEQASEIVGRLELNALDDDDIDDFEDDDEDEEVDEEFEDEEEDEDDWDDEDFEDEEEEEEEEEEDEEEDFDIDDLDEDLDEDEDDEP